VSSLPFLARILEYFVLTWFWYRHFPKPRLVQIESKGENDNSGGNPAARLKGGEKEEGWEEPEKKEMPQFLANHLKGICRHCECKKEILWRNFQRPEQHFDACFRYFDKRKETHKENQQPAGHEKRNGPGRDADTNGKETPEGRDHFVESPIRQDSLGKQEPRNKCFLKHLSSSTPHISENSLPQCSLFTSSSLPLRE
jgi:hypothetical protein